MFRKCLAVFLVITCLIIVPFFSVSAISNPLPEFMLSSKDMDDLSTYMNCGAGVINGKWYYGVLFKNKKFAGAGKMKLADISDKSVFLKNEPMNFIYVHQGWIYFLRTDKKYTIQKMTISGENLKTVVTPAHGDIMWMFIYNDRIYYSDYNETKSGSKSGGFYSIDLNGSGKKTILNKAVDYPYILNDQLLYSDANDGYHLHICDIDGKNDKVLIKDDVGNWVTDGYTIYYLHESSSGKCSIKSYDLKSNEIRTIVSNDTSWIGMHDGIIYYPNKDDAGRLYAYNPNNGEVDVLLQDKNIGIICFGDGGMFINPCDNRNKVTGIYYVEYDTYKIIDLSK